MIGNEKNGHGKPLEHWHHVLTGQISEGTRNSTLASVCGKLVHSGLSDVVLLLDVMLCINDARCSPPLGYHEVAISFRRCCVDISESCAPMNEILSPGLAELSEQLRQECPPAYSDEALALRFAERYADKLRYVAAWTKWLIWNGHYWQFDDTLKAFDYARMTCRGAASECDKKFANAIASAKTDRG
jgi:hypothetical protein